MTAAELTEALEARAMGTTVVGLRALREQGFDGLPGACPGRVGDRLSDLVSELDAAIAASSWDDVRDVRVRFDNLRLALDTASVVEMTLASRTEGES